MLVYYARNCTALRSRSSPRLFFLSGGKDQGVGDSEGEAVGAEAGLPTDWFSPYRFFYCAIISCHFVNHPKSEFLSVLSKASPRRGDDFPGARFRGGESPASPHFTTVFPRSRPGNRHARFPPLFCLPRPSRKRPTGACPRRGRSPCRTS